jgi:hypothetical protein
LQHLAVLLFMVGSKTSCLRQVRHMILLALGECEVSIMNEVVDPYERIDVESRRLLATLLEAEQFKQRGESGTKSKSYTMSVQDLKLGVSAHSSIHSPIHSSACTNTVRVGLARRIGGRSWTAL